MHIAQISDERKTKLLFYGLDIHTALSLSLGIAYMLRSWLLLQLYQVLHPDPGGFLGSD